MITRRNSPRAPSLRARRCLRGQSIGRLKTRPLLRPGGGTSGARALCDSALRECVQIVPTLPLPLPRRGDRLRPLLRAAAVVTAGAASLLPRLLSLSPNNCRSSRGSLGSYINSVEPLGSGLVLVRYGSGVDNATVVKSELDCTLARMFDFLCDYHVVIYMIFILKYIRCDVC